MLLRRVFALVSLLLLLAGEAVLACPVCFAETGADQRNAYLVTTVLLSALPLLLLGFLGARLYQGSRRNAGRRGALAEGNLDG